MCNGFIFYLMQKVCENIKEKYFVQTHGIITEISFYNKVVETHRKTMKKGEARDFRG